MLHRRYKQIRDASNKNLMSIEISILQAINSKDKSDIPDYLKYRDSGFMYFHAKRTFLVVLNERLPIASFDVKTEAAIKTSMKNGQESFVMPEYKNLYKQLNKNLHQKRDWHQQLT